MIIWLGLRWWYSAGWQWAWNHGVVRRSRTCFDFFSIRSLLGSLFAPFKQTYTGSVRGSLQMHVQAFIDKTVSRFIGFTIRSVLIFAGLFSFMIVLISGLLLLVLWAFIPLLPIASIVLMLAGVQ